jgi:hypothetical protein
MVIHVLQLSVRLGGVSEALAAIADTVVKRTGASGTPVDDIYAPSLSAGPLTVLDTYLRMPVLGSPHEFVLLSTFSVTALLVTCGTLVMVALTGKLGRQPNQSFVPLGLAWLVACLGPVGWLLLARPHSLFHTHLNTAIWYLGVIPLGMVLNTVTVSRGLVAVRPSTLPGAVVLMTAAATVACLVFSFATVR